MNLSKIFEQFNEMFKKFDNIEISNFNKPLDWEKLKTTGSVISKREIIDNIEVITKIYTSNDGNTIFSESSSNQIEKGISVEEYDSMIEQAVKLEDFEEAIRLRDLKNKIK